MNKHIVDDCHQKAHKREQDQYAQSPMEVVMHLQANSKMSFSIILQLAHGQENISP